MLRKYQHHIDVTGEHVSTECNGLVSRYRAEIAWLG